MRSKANFKSHPIHPILVSFPIAFFTGAFVFNLLSLIKNHEVFGQTGYYLAIGGIVSGLLAAIPGFIDYVYTIPPKSSAKIRATKHMLINITVIVLFAATLLLNQGNPEVPTWLTLVLQFTGLALMVIAGWLGGTLVYRNQIGVDHRYAEAGKWREKRLPYFEGKKIEIGKSDFLKLNQMRLIHLDGKRIVLARTEKGLIAFDDHCTHKGGSLADGTISGCTVQCPWHGSQFDVLTGKVKQGPAKENIKSYPVQIEGEKAFLILG